MNANCFRPNIDIYAINRANFALAQHSQHALGRFGGIVQQRVRARTRDERAIAQIITVGENFSRDFQPVRFDRARKHAAVGGKKNQGRIGTCNCACNSAGKFLVPHRHII